MSSSSQFVLEDPPTFHYADYIVFGVFLAVSSIIGIYVAYQSRNKQSAKQFLTGGGNMHWFPVTLSLVSSFTSAIFLFGFPAEMYLFGYSFMYFGISYMTGYVIAVHFYIPIYHNLKLTSAYEVSW